MAQCCRCLKLFKKVGKYDAICPHCRIDPTGVVSHKRSGYKIMANSIYKLSKQIGNVSLFDDIEI